MPNAHGQDDLAESGFEAIDGCHCDPVFQEEAGFLVLMATDL